MAKRFTSKEIKTLIISTILLVVGILFCLSLAMGNKALSYVLGTALIVVGVISLINSYNSKKPLLTLDAISGCAIAAFGMLYAGNELSWLIFNYVPFLLMTVGVAIIVDAFLKKFKEYENGKFVAELILGILSLALGLCMKFIGALNEYISLILGIVLICYAIFAFLTIFVNKKK